MKQERQDFRFKSFMIELIMAKLCDSGVDFSNYPEALQAFFTYLVTSELRERIVFEDNYAASKVGPLTDLVQIIDPVNPDNNVARLSSSKNGSSASNDQRTMGRWGLWSAYQAGEGLAGRERSQNGGVLP